MNFDYEMELSKLIAIAKTIERALEQIEVEFAIERSPISMTMFELVAKLEELESHLLGETDIINAELRSKS